MRHRRLKHLPAIRKIPDDLWDEIKLLLPPEKANNTIICRPIIPFRKVLNGIVHVLRTGCKWKMLPKEYGSGSTTCHRRFQQRIVSDVFRKLWIKLLERYDELKGIRWMEMAIA